MAIRPIRNTKQALAALRRARDLDGRGWQAELRGVHARYRNGTYSGHFERSNRYGDQAAEIFTAVEAFLERLI